MVIQEVDLQGSWIASAVTCTQKFHRRIISKLNFYNDTFYFIKSIKSKLMQNKRGYLHKNSISSRNAFKHVSTNVFHSCNKFFDKIEITVQLHHKISYTGNDGFSSSCLWTVNVNAPNKWTFTHICEHTSRWLVHLKCNKLLHWT